MTSGKKAVVSLDIVDAKSPANQYLVYLLEDKKTVSFQHPTEQRIRVVFEVLDKMTPQLGVFSKVLRLIRTELYDAFYSPPIQGSQVWKTSEPLPQVPYFSLMRRRQNERNEEVEKVESELHKVKTILLQREEEASSLQKNICALQQTNKTLQDAISALQQEAKENGSKIKELQKEIQEQNKLLEAKTEEYAASIAQLHDDLNTAQKEINHLEPYKEAYGGLQKAFQSPLDRKKTNMLSPISKAPTGRIALSAAHQAHVTSNLQTSKHLYQQLLQIQNRAMDDFDSFLENRMPVLPVGRATQQNPDDEMEIKKKTFLGCMAEISTELSLLRQQTDSLEEQNAARAEKRQKEEPLESQMVGMRRGPGSSTGSQEGSGKESIEDFVSMALHPDETLLNRYAAMIYTTTDNGRIYEEMAGASMCESCGEKTFLCPHKVGDTKVISLPKHCTHIKICRPQAHRLALAAKLEWLGDGLTPASSCIRSSGAFIPERAQITQKPLGDQLGQSAPSPSSWQGSWALEEINLSRLDKHFGEQMKVKREAPRMMSLHQGGLDPVVSQRRGVGSIGAGSEGDLCLSLAEQLLANVMYQEDGRPENPRVLSVQELLWELLTRRYVDEDISSLGLQDFLAAVWKYSTDNKVVCLLTRVLCGQLDQSVLRYVLLQAELLNLSPLTEPSHLLLFIEQHYPFLEETERDSLVLEFTAYSQRSISSACMMGFILHRILQNKEPLINGDRLLTHLKTQIGFLSSEELSRALGELASLSTKKQRDILIQQSASSLKSDLIPITHAAHILAYLTERGDAQKRNTRGHVAAVNNTLSTENRRHKGDESLKDFNDLCSLSNILNLVKSIKTVTGQAPQNMASFLKRK